MGKIDWDIDKMYTFYLYTPINSYKTYNPLGLYVL